jgi:phage-related protein
MLNETFYLDGIDARSAGIQLQAPIEFSAAAPVVKAQTIPGRNGDLIWGTGSYENRSGSASCFCLQKDVEKAISSAGRFLMGKKGYRRLETSDDPDHYWLARVENSPQIAMRLRTLAPFEIGFDCKPQRFVKAGENPVVFTANGSLFNQYGQVALPFITLYGQGAGRLTIGDCVVEVKALNGTLYLDSDTQNAYNGNGNQNLNINAPVFPVLGDGKIPIAFSGGIERVEIVPRWWEL